MGRALLVVLPIGVALAAIGLAALVLPACGIAPLAWLQTCPRPGPPASTRLDALAERQRALEAEIAGLQRRVAALPACEVPAPVVPPEPVVTAPPAAAPDIPRDRWDERDLSVLDGCWNLDSDYAMQDVQTRAISQVSAWQMCFDAAGRGQQTLRFPNGMTCSGPLGSTFNADGNLEIDDIADVACSQGARIFRRISTCSLNREGRADCVSRSVDHPGRATFTMRR